MTSSFDENISSMKRWMLFTVILTLIWISCDQEIYDESEFLAGDTFTDSNIRVVYFDTLTLLSSTMKFDSLVTANPSRALVGTYLDTIFGRIRAKTFFELSPTSYTINREAVYDSIALYLAYDKYYYNDTVQYNTINVKRVSERIRPDDETYYNTTNFDVFDDNLGQLVYRPRPLEADTLEIKISDEFGFELFEKMQQSELTDQDEFRDFFKGISLQPADEDNGSIIGFSSAAGGMQLRLYYSLEQNDDQVQEILDFNFATIGDPQPFFNQITSEDPNERLAQLIDQEIELASIDSNNESYIQSGVGITTKVQFPYVKSIEDIPGTGTLLDATIRLYPKTLSYDDNLRIRDTLDIFVVNQNNDVTRQLTYDGLTPVQATMVRDNQEFGEIYYEAPIGNFIEDLLLAEPISEDNLVFFPPDYSATVDRHLINGEDTDEYRAILQITYAIYDEDED